MHGSSPEQLAISASPNRKLWRWLVAFVLLASALVSFSGIGSVLPLDAHEVFVARTCEEMIARGEWMVPYFNDEPRLKKPPLEYWLVLTTNTLTGGDEIISEFEARFPSAIAGILMTAMAMAIGTLLVRKEVGLLAGATLATCSGYITYTHSARPEMVYAALCVAGILGLVCAERWALDSERKKHAVTAALLAWVFFGLATLTKGPQLPIPIMIGWLISAWRGGHLRESVRACRPVSGLAIYLVLSLWWFVAIWLTIPEAGEIWAGETISRYVEHDAEHGESWVKLLDPYYLYRPLALLVPWVFFVPGALVGPWLKRFKTKPGAMRLWWIILAAAVLLSLSRGRRWYYMLPLLVPYTVLISSTAMQFAEYLKERRVEWLWNALFAVHAIAIAVVAIVMAGRHDDRFGKTSMLLLFAVGAASAVYVVLLLLTKARGLIGAAGVAALACVSAAVCFAAVEARMGLWRVNRLDERDFALQVADVVGSDGVLLGWRDKWEEQQYYLHRPIPLFTDPDALAGRVESSSGAWVLVDARYQENALPESFNSMLVIRHDNGKASGQFELWRVEPD
jgi:4-amino-4-deoxy-L-arabinose transferase-like glycosyltransferase